MEDLIVETSNFSGDVILETNNFDGDYDNLFKGIRKAVKERGLIGGIGQTTGLSTNKGAEKRAKKKEDRATRKSDRNDRKNLMTDAKAGLKDAKAEEKIANADSARVQAESLASMPAQSESPEIAKPKNNILMFVGVGAAALALIAIVAFLLLRKKHTV